jgi:hypothetical protein
VIDDADHRPEVLKSIPLLLGEDSANKSRRPMKLLERSKLRGVKRLGRALGRKEL